MEMPCETRPENGAELVPTDNSAPHKVDLSSKVSIGRGEKARSSGWGAAAARPSLGFTSCFALFILISERLQLKDTRKLSPKLDSFGSGAEI